jgi:hypothetical protein
LHLHNDDDTELEVEITETKTEIKETKSKIKETEATLEQAMKDKDASEIAFLRGLLLQHTALLSERTALLKTLTTKENRLTKRPQAGCLLRGFLVDFDAIYLSVRFIQD